MEKATIAQIEHLAILPLGAHEYHGEHLPAETDAVIAEAFAKRLTQLVRPQFKIYALPVEKVGYSIEHMDNPVTRTLSYSEAIEKWIDIGVNCYRNGIKRLLILNAHGGNSPLMNIVITELRCRFPMLAVATSWGRFGLPNGLISETEKHLDIHAGFIETSLMLYLKPELVNMEKAGNFINRQAEFIKDFQYLRAYGPFAFGWKMRDLNAKGVAGDASKANARDGELIFNHALNGLTLLIDDMLRFNLNELAQ